MESLKKCSWCKEIKQYHDFSKLKSSPDGHSYECKRCRSRHYTPRVRIVRELPETNFKICTICKKEKDKSEFVRDSSRKDGFRPTCKKCRPPTKKKIMGFCKRCNVEYKIIYNKKASQICNDCKLTKKIQGSIHSLIFIVFKRCSRKKKVRTEEILGCSFEYFKNHIESQFENWMSWNNYGNTCENLTYNCSWDLDHIIPISLAKTEEEVYLLNHWSNFQPLCSKENRHDKKGKYFPCCNIIKPEINEIENLLDR
jgi:hypothetical protein